MHIGYILTIGFLAVWFGIKIAEKIRENKQKKALEKDTVDADSQNNDYKDLIL